MGTYIKALKSHEKKLLKNGITKKGPTITVSGLSGVGKSFIGESIAKHLKIRLVSMGDVFRELAKEKGMKLEEFDNIRTKKLDLELDKKTLELAMKGNIVIVARISGWVAGDYADYKLWIACEDKTRIKRTAERENLSFNDAKKYLDTRDNANTKRYKQIYKINQNDLSTYDAIIDNARMSKEQARRLPAKLIENELYHQKIFKKSKKITGNT